MIRNKKKRKIKLRRLFLLFLAIIIVITGCLGHSKVKNADSDNDKEEETEVAKLQIIDENSNTRSIAIMINNIAEARPYQSGLQDAYLVYEMIVEGGITRLMAVFKDQNLERVGPVRSSRHYYLDYALENDAIYTHFGWSTYAEDDIASLDINNINGLYDSGFWRETDLPVAYEHTAFTSTENILNVAAHRNYRTTTDQATLLNYSVEEVDISIKEGAIAATNVTIPYSDYVTTSYKYNPILKRYYRSVNGEAHVDYVTDRQYYAKNIIIAKVKNYSIDSYGRQNLDNIGTGDGYYITDGYAVPIKWTKTSRSSQTVYTYLDGTEITVNDGNTFIQIEPISENPTFSE
ncbi:MAG: DUF3048 domain-containing protein [Bacilli bacterium]|nr:DUF3048 domain-containing protein [Bacilli bacterium]